MLKFIRSKFRSVGCRQTVEVCEEERNVEIPLETLRATVEGEHLKDLLERAGNFLLIIV